MPCRDEVDADFVGLEAEEGDIVWAEISGCGGNDGDAFAGFDCGQDGAHVVEFVLQVRGEAVVIADAEDGVEDGRRTGAAESYEAFAGEVGDANALSGDFAGLGEGCYERFLKEQAGLVGGASICGWRPSEGNVDFAAIEGQVLSVRDVFDKTQGDSWMAGLEVANKAGKEG